MKGKNHLIGVSSDCDFQGACYPEAFGGECFGTPTPCRPCNQVVSCGGNPLMSHLRCFDNPGSPLRKAIENGQEGPGCAGYNCRLNGDQEGLEKDQYPLKIDIRQGVVLGEEKAEGSEDSSQVESIGKSNNSEGAEVADLARSVVFTTERAWEIAATTTEEVDSATIKPMFDTFNFHLIKLTIVFIYFYILSAGRSLPNRCPDCMHQSLRRGGGD